MKVSGSIYEDYRFFLEDSDYGFVNARFVNSDLAGFSSTFSIYKEIPDFMIKDAEYKPSQEITKISPKTMAPRTKTEFLFIHDLCVDIDSGMVTEISKMKMAGWKDISGYNGMIYANHIPAVFAPFDGGVIMSVEGNWNPALNKFTGSIQVGSLEGLKNALIGS